MLCEAEVSHHVCVATPYGSDVMEKNAYADIHTGRMDAGKMRAFFNENGIGAGDIVVDATHPYAADVSANIKQAVEGAGCVLYCISRTSLSAADDSYVNLYDDMKDFACIIDKTEGNVLLTTGSRDIGEYCANVSEETLHRTYVRVIPATESIEACRSYGIEASHIIAMQGPFSYDLNRALLMQYEIKHMLTKDSGEAGGFGEKIRAASGLGVRCHVLARPHNTKAGEGMSVYEVYEKITGRKYKRKRKIYLCGTGMGNAGLMTGEVVRAIRSADALFGAPSVLDKVCDEVFGSKAPSLRKYEMYLGEDIKKVLSEEVDITSAAVLFSGDSGFFSGAKKCARILSDWDDEAEIIQLPGICAVSYLASRLGEAYDDAKIFSIHGDDSLHNINNLICEIKHNNRTFALMSKAGDVPVIAEKISSSDMHVRMVIGRDLSHKDECIKELTADEAVRYDGDGKITVLFINEAPEKRKIVLSFSDDEFIRDNVPMTKECIRHESIRRLGLCEGDLVYDIGGGTGSVAIETASLDPSLKVVTIEKNAKAAQLIRKNIKKFGICNISVVDGEAEDVIPSMQKPDCVFIGGSGGKMSRIISLISTKGRGVRYVVNAVSLETMDEVRKIMEAENAADRRAVQISVSDIETVGEHHMLKANNPVTVFSFTI